jgi:hypothetical protein
MGTQRVQMKEVLPWLARWACRAGTRDCCPALAAPKSAQHKTFFSLTAHYFILFVPIPQQAVQAVVLSRLSPNMVDATRPLTYYDQISSKKYGLLINKNGQEDTKLLVIALK